MPKDGRSPDIPDNRKTSKDLVERVQEITGESYHMSREMVCATLQGMRELLSEADPRMRLELRQLGRFEVRIRKGYTRHVKIEGRCDGDYYTPPRRYIHFKPNRQLTQLFQVAIGDLPSVDDPSIYG